MMMPTYTTTTFLFITTEGIFTSPKDASNTGAPFKQRESTNEYLS
jgi:hypothetical protein